jgi:hypothetical protein
MVLRYYGVTWITVWDYVWDYMHNYHEAQSLTVRVRPARAITGTRLDCTQSLRRD